MRPFQPQIKIQQLPNNQDKGDAFEVFAQAYLATQKLHSVKYLWTHHHIPLSIREKLHLPIKEMGVDGVFEDIKGNLITYQVKFRSDKQSLSWNELSTFMGLSDFADQRLLITNTDSVTGVMPERKNYSSVLGHRLDQLEARDFENILQWLQDEQFEPQLFIPRPYQQEAVDKI